jgi:hypothetical protein
MLLLPFPLSLSTSFPLSLVGSDDRKDRRWDSEKDRGWDGRMDRGRVRKRNKRMDKEVGWTEKGLEGGMYRVREEGALKIERHREI